jgi:3',5'-cyclic AMP phosphodiesterase CpdA
VVVGDCVKAGSGLYAVSDLHVGYADNRQVVQRLYPVAKTDWLIVAGDIGELMSDISWALRLLSERFDTVIWAPGNHELWTPPHDPVRLRGEKRYHHLVRICRSLGILTPEDPYPLWTGSGGPVAIVPLFLLYDYSFLPDGMATKEAALAHAWRTGVVCTDEMLLHPDPYPDRETWCRTRIEITESRLTDLDPSVPTVLVNHFPLVREPTRILRYPEFVLWCGTERTASWHVRFNAIAVIYGHLHIPRTMWLDGVRFEEVSTGYPREWRQHGRVPGQLRRVLPAEGNA